MKKKSNAEAPKNAQNKPEKSAGVNAPKKPQNASKGKIKRSDKVFSFRCSEDDLNAWKLYAMIKGMRSNEFGTYAMNEYIKHHPLIGDEVDWFNVRIGNKELFEEEPEQCKRCSFWGKEAPDDVYDHCLCMGTPEDLEHALCKIESKDD